MRNRKLIVSAVIPFLLIGFSACSFPTTEAPLQSSPTQKPVSTSKPTSEQQDSSDAQNKATLSITADRTNINAGECTQLRWNVKGGYQVEINGNDQSWTGEQQVCPTQSKTYSLCVDTGEEWECEDVSITVNSQQIQNQPPPAPPANQPKTSTINVVNNSGAEICGVYIRPTSDPALFNLIPSKTLPNGSSQSFSFPIPDTYQIAIYGCHHNNLILLEEIQLSEGGYICNVPPLVLDLAITDLYPDNMPKGMLVIRITNRGHVMAPQEEISIACDAVLTPVPGAFAPAQPMHSEFVNLSAISVGNTNAQTAYMDLDTDSFSYSVTCRITNVPSIFTDPNLANNTYSENIP